ncbi:MAG: hypothetical protein GX868_06180, partial [Actinobacteria bacterium]|nr:hypothetical protein [Actinomycetota bacterium]
MSNNARNNPPVTPPFNQPLGNQPLGNQPLGAQSPNTPPLTPPVTQPPGAPPLGATRLGTQPQHFDEPNAASWNLTNWLTAQRNAGVTPDVIAQRLVANGWSGDTAARTA